MPGVPAQPTAPVVGAPPPEQQPPETIKTQNAIVGGGSVVAMNTMTSGMTGEPGILLLSGGLNLMVQGVKEWEIFDEKHWTLWLLLALGIAFAAFIWRDPQRFDLTHFWDPNYFELPGKAILNGMGSAFQAAINYHGLAATGVSPLKPASFEHSVEGKQARQLAAAPA